MKKSDEWQHSLEIEGWFSKDKAIGKWGIFALVSVAVMRNGAGWLAIPATVIYVVYNHLPAC